MDRDEGGVHCAAGEWNLSKSHLGRRGLLKLESTE